MKSTLPVSVVVLFIFLILADIGSATTPNSFSLAAPSSTSNSPTSVQRGLYWFQVGVWGANGGNWGNQFGVPITGASVEIRINYKHSFSPGAYSVAYWVGINLPGDSFIQVGYGITTTGDYPQWFWEYFRPGTASAASGGFLGEWGDEIGPNGAWYSFSLQSSGTRWYAFVNGAQVGSVDLGVPNSGGNGPYAVAEIPGIRNANTHLGPVEFRNLQYRDVSSSWHMVSGGVSLCCFGSDTYSDTYAVTGSFPYGVESVPGENNFWLAGSNLDHPIQEVGHYLWPWYSINVEGLPRGWTYPNGWYVYDSTIDLSNIPATISITATSRYELKGWYVNGVLQSAEGLGIFEAKENSTLKPRYMQQWFVQVNSNMGTPTGSGWYNDGATATIGVRPAYIPDSGILGDFGLGSELVGWAGYNLPVLNGKSTIQVKSPIVIAAIWGPNYGVLPYYSLLIIPCIALALYFRRLQHSSA